MGNVWYNVITRSFSAFERWEINKNIQNTYIFEFYYTENDIDINDCGKTFIEYIVNKAFTYNIPLIMTIWLNYNGIFFSPVLSNSKIMKRVTLPKKRKISESKTYFQN